MKGESGASDDELASDVLSHYSSASESASVVDEATGGYTHTPTDTHTARQGTASLPCVSGPPQGEVVSQ